MDCGTLECPCDSENLANSRLRCRRRWTEHSEAATAIPSRPGQQPQPRANFYVGEIHIYSVQCLGWPGQWHYGHCLRVRYLPVPWGKGGGGPVPNCALRRGLSARGPAELVAVGIAAWPSCPQTEACCAATPQTRHTWQRPTQSAPPRSMSLPRHSGSSAHHRAEHRRLTPRRGIHLHYAWCS